MFWKKAPPAIKPVGPFPAPIPGKLFRLKNVIGQKTLLWVTPFHVDVKKTIEGYLNVGDGRHIHLSVRDGRYIHPSDVVLLVKVVDRVGRDDWPRYIILVDETLWEVRLPIFTSPAKDHESFWSCFEEVAVL